MLWLWHRPAAVTLISALAWELPYATDVALKKKRKEKKKNAFILSVFYPKTDRQKNSVWVLAHQTSEKLFTHPTLHESSLKEKESIQSSYILSKVLHLQEFIFMRVLLVQLHLWLKIFHELGKKKKN